jgi:phosphatidylethanolamine-binding protein (PEBP) family uncharacterized protein
MLLAQPGDCPVGIARIALTDRHWRYGGISCSSEVTTDWKRTGGPCPPVGTHRYFHKQLYALDTTLALERPDKA